MIERGAERETHSETANENARIFQCARFVAACRGECFLGSVHAARHQGLVVGQNQILSVAAD